MGTGTTMVVQHESRPRLLRHGPSIRPVRYLRYDVFADQPYLGNPLAVFLGAGGLSAGQRQQLAGEMNLSECTFVGPASGDADHQVRIHTPTEELPMAGHPTIGTAFALADEGLIEPGSPGIVFGLGVGPTPVTLAWSGNRLDFAWMRQLRPQFRDPAVPVADIVRASGVSPAALGPGLPVQEVSCGVPFILVPCRSRAAVDDADPDAAAFRLLRSAFDVPFLGILIFTTEPGDDDATAYARMFAPGAGIVEDPATGGAAGPLGCYLARHGLVRGDHLAAIVVRQGVRMGRPSRIHVAVSLEGGEVTDVRVGGRAVRLGRGEVEVLPVGQTTRR